MCFLSVSFLFSFSVYPSFYFSLYVFVYRFLDLDFTFVLLSSKIRFYLITTVYRFSLTSVYLFPFNYLGYLVLPFMLHLFKNHPD